MMKSICVGALLLLLTASCQKELHFEAGEVVEDQPFRIVKTIAITGTDTLITEYSYDRELRLEMEVTQGKYLGQPYNSDTRYNRDGVGRIMSIQHGSTDGGPITTTVHYPNATTLEFDYFIAVQPLNGQQSRDSVAASYIDGDMSSSEHYSYINGGYVLSGKETFVHNPLGNVTSADIYTALNGSLALVSKVQYTYSSYKDYIWTSVNGAQNYLLTGLPNKRHMNVEELRMKDQTGILPSDIVSTTKLTLDPTGTMALSGVRSLSPQNTTTNLTFYYQYY